METMERYETPPFACPRDLPPAKCNYPHCIRPARSAYSSKCETAQHVAVDRYKDDLRKEADERLVNGMQEKERAYRLSPEEAGRILGGGRAEQRVSLQDGEQPVPCGQPVDPVHPAHYKQHPSGVECIDIIEHMTFNTGTAIKYLWRAGNKPGESAAMDLRKAIWYIEREMQRVTKN